MAQNTEHYNLVKPDYTDPADVSQLNDNMDTIDGILWQLANAGADDELLAKVQEILDKIGETDDTGGSTVAGTVMAKLNNIQANTDGLDDNLAYLNSTIDSSNPVPIDVLMTQLLYGTVFEYSSPGNYTLLIPANVNQIKVTACGGGGAGASTIGENARCGGGGGGAAINEQIYSVTPQSNIAITVGAGGQHGSGSSPESAKGRDGQPTIIGNIVTLAGGRGGLVVNISDSSTDTGGQSGGSGGGKGGNGKTVNVAGENGGNGIIGAGGIGGTSTYSSCGSGGGGGGAGTKAGTSGDYGGNGGNGYVKIELIITP